MSFTTVLIANRGEIACRVIRTARAMGLRTIAVYSEADAEALHVRLADQAVAIGLAPAGQSYLNIAAMIEAARRTGAEAVHPGYGFLSENAEFAAACATAGLIFIGPPEAAIRAMGNKAQAKRLMRQAGVPIVPGGDLPSPADPAFAAEAAASAEEAAGEASAGAALIPMTGALGAPGYDGPGQSDQVLLKAAKSIGFPVMIKAAAGGGGRGMRLVVDGADFAAALAVARGEAMSAFGSDEIILERALTGARHVEIQVFADRHGNVIHLGERDCSVQRRHQKVIEEAPAPGVSIKLRAAMGKAAVAAARAVDYVGAGTVEFLLDNDGKFYFLEMNTRLQVEYAVTEAITGLDLVAWQFKIAAGDPLPLKQNQVKLTGHAIEARLYAEDAAAGFLPQSGELLAWRPPAGQGIRVDHGLRAAQTIGPWYDPMLAKIIARAETRDEARRRLIAALDKCVVLGLPTNRRLLVDILSHPVFAAGQANTDFIPEHFPRTRLAALSVGAPIAPDIWMGAAPAEASPAASSAEAAASAAKAGSAGEGRSPLGARALALAAVLWFEVTSIDLPAGWRGWHSSGAAAWPLKLRIGGQEHRVSVAWRAPDGEYRVAIGDGAIALRILDRDGNDVRFRADGIDGTAHYAFSQDELHLDCDGATLAVAECVLALPAIVDGSGAHELRAPMSGKIVAVFAQTGANVTKGQRLVVLEAMKMQHEIVAAIAGTVNRVAVKEGDQVDIRQMLVAISPLVAAHGDGHGPG